jgi:hypothetical protein
LPCQKIHNEHENLKIRKRRRAAAAAALRRVLHFSLLYLT